VKPTRPASALASLRPVVLGSEGRSGAVLAEHFSRQAPETVAATRFEMDVTDYFNLRWELERLEADLVVNAAAWTDVDGCEEDPERCFRINAEAAGLVAQAARVCGARLIHLSTDYVFDGAKGAPYHEEDPPGPLSVYGRCKLAGELLVRKSHPSALIVRTAWLFGGRGRRPGFVESILEQARQAHPIPVARDQIGSPTCVDDLALGIEQLIRVGAAGIVHLAGGGEASRAEFAEAVIELAGLSGVSLVPVEAARLRTAARRPPDSRLDTSRFRELTGVTPRHWRDALGDVLSPPGAGG
jgi:dTDP-4-dehydrorhamnose reductase